MIISFSPARRASTHASAAATFLSATARTTSARPVRYSYSNLGSVTFPDLRGAMDALSIAAPSTAALSLSVAAASDALAASSSLIEPLIVCSAAAISASTLSASSWTHWPSCSISAFSFSAASVSSSSCRSVASRSARISPAISSAAVTAPSRHLASRSAATSCRTCAPAFFSCSSSRPISSASRAASVRVRSMDAVNWRLSPLADSSSARAMSSLASAACSDGELSCPSSVISES
uniref:Uncharacterized protein n=1 Tax=Triticum urartu TaxID=4572 RepID=A0A8R7K354_TRIUA